MRNYFFPCQTANSKAPELKEVTGVENSFFFEPVQFNLVAKCRLAHLLNINLAEDKSSNVFHSCGHRGGSPSQVSSPAGLSSQHGSNHGPRISGVTSCYMIDFRTSISWSSQVDDTYIGRLSPFKTSCQRVKFFHLVRWTILSCAPDNLSSLYTSNC